MFLLVFLCLFFIQFPTVAIAHDPYFGESHPLELPGNRRGSIRLLYGDGIFFADPVQAVVVEDNNIVAASKVDDLLYIECDRDLKTTAKCWAYAPYRGMVFVPDFNRLKPLSLVTDQGRPTTYPSAKLESGFTYRQASLSEILWFEFHYIASSTGITSFFGILSFILLGMILILV